MYKNPFTPVFGNEPPILAGRDYLINDVLRGLDNGPGDPNRVTIFTGPRGSGKTVLLSKIASDAEGIGWISVHSPAMSGMLDDIRDQVALKGTEFFPAKSMRKIAAVQAAGFGLSVETPKEEDLSFRIAMGKYLDLLAEKDIGLLFTIDEVAADVPDLIRFVSTFQTFIIEKRNVALLMAGLPNKVLQMFQDSSITYLRRAFRRRLDPIKMPEVRSAMRKTIELSGRKIEENALQKAAENTGGFPFLMQLIGYYSYNQTNRKMITFEDVEMGTLDAREDMESMILDATLYGLSEMDTKFLIAMAEDEEISEISNVAARLGVNVNYAGEYRRRLNEQGIISSAGRGKIVFNIPMLKTLIAERYLSQQRTGGIHE
jgi:AAA+ ATPase superfamily predicted ATPase